MNLLLLLMGSLLPAAATTWTPPRQARALLDEEGRIEVPAGVALRIEPRPEVPLPEVMEVPTVRDAETGELQVLGGPDRPLELRGVSEGLLVPAAPTTRLLRLVGDGPSGEARGLRLRLTTRREELVAWLQAERRLVRARDVDGVSLPWGSQAQAALLRLRARAVADPAVRALGTALDLATLAPLHRTTHALRSTRTATLPPGTPWSETIAGPGTLSLRLRPRTETGWVRTEAQLRLDGKALAGLDLAGSGTVFTGLELFVPPGIHELSLEPLDLPVDLALEVAQLRRPVFGQAPPDADTVAGDPLSAAELAWLRGDRAQAVEAFRPFLGEPGPRGDLARARVLRASTEPGEILALAQLPDPPPGGAELADAAAIDGRIALVDAVLSRADELPPELVARAILRCPAPDLPRVAAWLDSLGGQRPRGVALLRATRPLVDDAADQLPAELRHRTLRSRFQDLAPVEESPPSLRIRTRGPGLPRLELAAGEAMDLVLPEWSGRAPVLRLRVQEEARWTLDGQTWSSAGGTLGIALEPGGHRLELESGVLHLLDREVSRGGGHLVYETEVVPLPARFELPDPGARVDLRLAVDPPVPLRLVFDDGVVRELVPDGAGVAELEVGAWAEHLDISARPGSPEGTPASVAVQIRQRLPGIPGPPPPPVTDIPGAMAELADLSRAVDEGRADARLARAALLGRMGLLGVARRDLQVLLAPTVPPADAPAPPEQDMRTRALKDRARLLASNLAPATPSASAPGPTSVEAALARHEDRREIPEGPPEERARALERAAQELDEPALWLLAAQSWAQVPDGPRAWAAALRAGAMGEELRGSLEARTRWTWLSYARGGVGMVRVAAPSRSEARGPLWRQARAAMLAPPWEGPEVSVLRGDVSELLQVPAGQVELSVFCRDEDGPARPCRVPLRLGQQGGTLLVPDGQVETLVLPLSVPTEIELGSADPGQAVVLRTLVDGVPLVGRAERSALRAAPRAPLSLVVGGPVLVRIDPQRGAGLVSLDGEEQGTVSTEGPMILAIAEPGTHEIQVEGDVDVRFHAAAETLPAPTVADLAGLVALDLASEPLPIAIDALFEQLSSPPVTALRAPGDGGSVELGLALLREQVYSPVPSPWHAAQAQARYLLASPRWWGQAGAWARGPGWAEGLLVEGGPQWTGGFASLRADAALAHGDLERAGEVGGGLRGRHDLGLSRELDLRLDGRLRATWSSPTPKGSMDPRAWSQWRAWHPLYLDLASALVGSPSRDLRWELGLRALSNSPGQGPQSPVDRLGPFAGVDLAFPWGMVATLDGRLEWRFPDRFRADGSLGGRADLRLEQGLWQGETRWWKPWFELGVRSDPAEWVGGVGLDLLLSARRGLRDLPPGSLVFRSLRELP